MSSVIQAAEPVSEKRGCELSILIVDDNHAVTRALAKVISRHGMKPIPCLSAAEALQQTKDNPPAAAVVDIHLPDLSGLILTQQLRIRMGDQAPIIILSGDGSREVLSSLPHVGATYFFSKPVNTSALVDQLQRLLEIECQDG